MTWIGSISLSDSSILQDVHLTALANSPPLTLPDKASLHFLSIVETARIPLHLAIAAPRRVTTSNEETERWFGQIFANPIGWWECAKPDSELGVLVGVEVPGGDGGKAPCVTELLFYATSGESGEKRLLTPPPSSPNGGGAETKSAGSLTVHALALSSDLLYGAGAPELTPPSSPAPADEEVEAVFLPPTCPAETSETINEPPVRKRRSAADAFDEASERRNKARRRGGEGVSAAAALKNESHFPSLEHRRLVSNTHAVPLQTRPLSRSPSVSSSRPPTGVAPTTKKSALSQVQSSVEPTATEMKNKEFISRTVMAGMRLYGLSQSKYRSRLKAESSAPSLAVDVRFSELETERKQDEEFKLIYHQAYKGTCFAFREGLATQMLQPFAEQVRETVDRLLAIFCSNPLAGGLQGGVDEVTPGGRKAFGTKAAAEEPSPFLRVAGVGGEASTPSTRRKDGG